MSVEEGTSNRSLTPARDPNKPTHTQARFSKKKKITALAAITAAVVLIVGISVGVTAGGGSSATELSDGPLSAVLVKCGAATTYSLVAQDQPYYWFKAAGSAACCKECPTATVRAFDCGLGVSMYETTCKTTGLVSISYYDATAVPAAAATAGNSAPVAAALKAAPLCAARTPVSTKGATCVPRIPAAVNSGAFYTQAKTGRQRVTLPALTAAQKAAKPAFGVDRKLLWSDEFDGTALNAAIWRPGLGNGCDIGNCQFGNGELQTYQAENVAVKDGVLTLQARAEATINGTGVTSGKIESRAPFTIQYGRVEANMSLPNGKGGWPSFYLLPLEEAYGPWPASGEIDILETYNIQKNESTSILSSLHYGAPLYLEQGVGQNGCVMMDGTSFGNAWHVLALEWSPRNMKFFIDDMLFCEMSEWWTSAVSTQDNPLAPYDQPFYIKLSLAVGGQVPQVLTADAIPAGTLPMDFQIDYLRVYEMTPAEEKYVNPFPGKVLPVTKPLPGVTPEPKTGSYHYDFATGLHAPPTVIAASMRIDMEFFDYGGNGVAYKDTTPLVNTGNSALRPHDGVDMYQENVYMPPFTGKFVSSSGAFVKFSEGEWTAYTIEMPELYDQQFIKIKHSAIAGAGFKIIANSRNCLDPTADKGGLLVLDAPVVAPSRLAGQPPTANLTANTDTVFSPCWQTQYWSATPLPKGQHTLVFCSYSNDFNVQWMEFTPYIPVDAVTEGPGCA